MEEKKDPAQEPAAKKPRLERELQSPAPAAQDPLRNPLPMKEQHDAAPAAQDAASSHGSLSQETLLMGAGSPVVDELEES